MPRTLTISSLIILAAIQYMPCLADSSRSTEVVDVKDGVRYEYKQRLRDLKDQINNGLDKGWIKADQASALMAEHDRLHSATIKIKKAGWPKEQVNKLEKDVTAFSARVSTTLSKGTAPSAASGSTNK